MIEITLVKIKDSLPFDKYFMEYLSFERRIRIFNFTNEADKKRSLLAELLIKKETNEHTGIPVDKVRIGFNQYGKPYIPNTRNFKFNVSHSGSFVVIAVNKYSIGIDIEQIKEIDMAIAKRFFTGNEYAFIESLEKSADRIDAFYQLWTLKESYIKATGKGLRIPLNSFEFLTKDEIIFRDKNNKSKYSFNSIKLDEYWMSFCYEEKNANIKYIYLKEEEIYNYYKGKTRKSEK